LALERARGIADLQGWPQEQHLRRILVAGGVFVPLNDRQQVREAYASWLQQYQWDDFLTVTFRSPRKEPYYAAKTVWHELQKSGAGRAFLGVEPHNSGDLHIHGIISESIPGGRPSIDLPWNIWNRLFERFGRSTVEMCRDPVAVTSYCAKYILKNQGPMDHYYVMGSTAAWKLGRLDK
jgi:hypothetical protein